MNFFFLHFSRAYDVLDEKMKHFPSNRRDIPCFSANLSRFSPVYPRYSTRLSTFIPSCENHFCPKNDIILRKTDCFEHNFQLLTAFSTIFRQLSLLFSPNTHRENSDYPHRPVDNVENFTETGLFHPLSTDPQRTDCG